MLIQFRFKNFKSFRDDTILDLSATKITEHADHVVQIGNERILPTAAIYGANASGKSNVIEAFRYMSTYVLDSFGYGGEGGEKKSKTKRPKLTPFLFDNTSKNAESSFEVYFITAEEDGCKSYNYGFTLNQNGVVEEWLNTKSKTARKYKSIFYRSGRDLDLSGLPTKNQDIIKMSLYDEALIVSLGAMQRITKLRMVRDWFYNVSFTNFGNPLENAFLSSLIPAGFADDKAVQKKVLNYFSAFDPSIIGFHTEVIKGGDDDVEHVKIDAIHSIIGTDRTASIPLQDESDGTLKMFALYPALQETMSKGSILLVDELNARLHPLLVRGFILLFLNPETNPKHAQLVFSTHDSWQLSNNLLRRDEVWFTEKTPSGVSSLYSLADFVSEDGTKIRKDESYEKNYLLGKYGAIPSLKYFDMFKEG